MTSLLAVIFLLIGGFVGGIVMGIVDRLIGYKKEANVWQAGLHNAGWMLQGVVYWLVMHNGLGVI